MLPCLTIIIIMYGSRISGAIQGKEFYPHLHLSVIAFEKGAFRSPSTMFSQLTYTEKQKYFNYKILHFNKTS